jgi:transcription initiation factor IIF auxiliary subunit
MKKPARKLLPIGSILIGFALLAAVVPVRGQELTLANTSEYAGDGRWDWTVYVKAETEVIAEIEKVEYTLHPTFPRPVRTVTEPGDPEFPFGLSTNGWGTFTLSAKVTFHSGETRHLRHTLIFEARLPEQPLEITAANTATRVNSRHWRWTVFIRGPEESLARIRCVRYTLHPTFRPRTREICDRGTGEKAFALTATGWGTFTVGIRVFLKDGRVHDLSHELRFR